VGWATVMHGGVLVNHAGQRFGNETQGYSEYAREVLAQPEGTAVMVLDRKAYDACLVFDDFRQSVDSGALRWVDDAPALAAAFDLPAEALGATVSAARAHAEAGTTDEFGRSHWAHPLDPPLAGVRVTAALFHTQGGPRVDDHARVLHPDGTPTPGLYASGGAAAGISGHGPAGYLAGNGLLPALGLAFLAAEHAAETAGHPVPSGQGTGSGAA
ncbi:MAG: FAD-binding protein, partial [Acidimicrobiales bacterium]